MRQRKTSRFHVQAKIRRLLWISAFVSASFLHATGQCGTTGATGAIQWTTNWCDEFNGATMSPIDSTKWTYDTGNSGFGNNELETYCDPASNVSPCDSTHPNAYIDGTGHLAIQVRSAGSTWTSARLKTQGLQGFNSGRIEASLEIPSHAGLWPAFWMLGSESGVSWPTVGESDIMENWPATSNIPGPGATGNRSTVHTQVSAGSGIGKDFSFPSGEQVDTAFHVYGQIWSANMIQFYVDDPTQPFFVVTASDLSSTDTWPFSSSQNPFFIIVNVAVGGTLGTPTDSATGSQQPMLVDYVRQYLPSAVPAPELSAPAALSLKAGATTGNSTSLNLTGTQGTGRVAFSCTTTAPKASCVVTSTDPVNQYTVDFSHTASASATVTVTTTANTSASGMASLGWMGVFGSSALALALLAIRRAGQPIRAGAFLAGLVLAFGMWPGCGGSSGGGTAGGGGGSNGTTPGNYSVTVNAYTVSSSDVTKPSASASFNLTVN
jgi:beta-glucanase (GH16 family)